MSLRLSTRARKRKEHDSTKLYAIRFVDFGYEPRIGNHQSTSCPSGACRSFRYAPTMYHYPYPSLDEMSVAALAVHLLTGKTEECGQVPTNPTTIMPLLVDYAGNVSPSHPVEFARGAMCTIVNACHLISRCTYLEVIARFYLSCTSTTRVV